MTTSRATLAVLALVVGCARDKPLELPPGDIQAPVAAIVDTLATLDGKVVEIVRAFEAHGETPHVGVEFFLDLSREHANAPIYLYGFDLIDADTGAHLGWNRHLYQLTATGEKGAFYDPAFLDEPRMRLLAFWPVDEKVRRIRLEYSNVDLSGPVAVAATGPEVPAVVEQAVAIHELGQRPNGSRRLGVTYLCDPCVRVAPPPIFSLFAGDAEVPPARILEIDADLTPLTARFESQPLMLRRTWVVEFWVPPNAGPLEIERYWPHRTALPTTVQKLPPVTVVALARTDVFPRALAE